MEGGPLKLSDLSDEEWATRLERRRQEQLGTIRESWEFYDGTQPLYYVARILEEQDYKFPALTINWCRKFIDWMDARCTVEGFRLDGNDEADTNLWRIWQRNDLDLDASENNVATLVTGLSGMMVGPANDGSAAITVESPESFTVEIDPVSRRTIAARKVWKSDPEQALEDMAELWLPGPKGARLITYENMKPVGEQTFKWMQVAQKGQASPEVPFVPFMNRRRRLRGYSELDASIRQIVTAANQVASNMMAGVEHHAVPRKWALQVSQNGFQDKDGNPIPAWKAAMGAVWALPIDEDSTDAQQPKVGQFAASDLRNFHETISLLARVCSGLMDLAPSELGVGVADNPPAADGIMAAKESGVRRVERFHVGQGAGYEKVMRLAAAVEENDPSKMAMLETIWRDPSTPTIQAKSAAAVATFEAGISDLYQARVDYGYTDTQIKGMEAREQAAADTETDRLLRVVPDAGSSGDA